MHQPSESGPEQSRRVRALPLLPLLAAVAVVFLGAAGCRSPREALRLTPGASASALAAAGPARSRRAAPLLLAPSVPSFRDDAKQAFLAEGALRPRPDLFAKVALHCGDPDLALLSGLLPAQRRPIGVRPVPRPGPGPTERRLYTSPFSIGVKGFGLLLMDELGEKIDNGYGAGISVAWTLPIRSLRQRQQALAFEFGAEVSLHETAGWFGGVGLFGYDVTQWRIPFGLKWSFMTDRPFEPYLCFGTEYHVFIIDAPGAPDLSGWGGYLGLGFDYYFGRRLTFGLAMEARMGRAGGKSPLFSVHYDLVGFAGCATLALHF